ncbi:MAG: peptidylprolyl isomerase [Actinobacteria bacterium]|nr:peptidylprolyl isomerase [Actinomycetota bacterium]
MALVALAAVALTGCATGSDVTPEKKPAATSSAENGSENSAAKDPAACDYAPSGNASKKVELPSGPKPSGTVTVTLKTSVGELTAQLDADRAPCTVESFVSLAEQGFFNSTSCHRLTTDGIYVLQCGDPTGLGSGGPGYSFADELSKTASSDYIPGTLATANAGPDTNGSQFFLVYGDSTGLPPAYTVFGFLEPASLDLVKSVAAAGTISGGPDGAPKKKVTIDSVSVG